MNKRNAETTSIVIVKKIAFKLKLIYETLKYCILVSSIPKKLTKYKVTQ